MTDNTLNSASTEAIEGIFIQGQLDKNDQFFRDHMNAKNRLAFHVKEWVQAKTDGEKVMSAAEVNYWKERMGQLYVDWLVSQMEGREIH